MGEARKLWTKKEVLILLETIVPSLERLEKLANGAGQMPLSLRKKIVTANARTKTLISEFQNWAITSGEKTIAEVKPQKESTRRSTKKKVTRPTSHTSITRAKVRDPSNRAKSKPIKQKRRKKK